MAAITKSLNYIALRDLYSEFLAILTRTFQSQMFKSESNTRLINYSVTGITEASECRGPVLMTLVPNICYSDPVACFCFFTLMPN